MQMEGASLSQATAPARETWKEVQAAGAEVQAAGEQRPVLILSDSPTSVTSHMHDRRPLGIYSPSVPLSQPYLSLSPRTLISLTLPLAFARTVALVLQPCNLACHLAQLPTFSLAAAEHQSMPMGEAEAVHDIACQRERAWEEERVREEERALEEEMALELMALEEMSWKQRALEVEISVKKMALKAIGMKAWKKEVRCIREKEREAIVMAMDGGDLDKGLAIPHQVRQAKATGKATGKKADVTEAESRPADQREKASMSRKKCMQAYHIAHMRTCICIAYIPT